MEVNGQFHALTTITPHGKEVDFRANLDTMEKRKIFASY
jgi:hypothetical protein